MKIIAAPDKFKGSMTAEEAAEIIKSAIKKVIPESEGICVPLADGGEGTMEAIVRSLNGNIIEKTVDDDVYFAEDSVEKMLTAMVAEDADCVSANVFPNQDMRFRQKVLKGVFYGELPSFRKKFAFRIRKSSSYSYCNNPREVMESQSCAGPCMLIKKSVNNSLDYQDELWLDQFPYTSGQDQIFAYKLYRYGYKLCIHYTAGVIHLDCKTGHVKDEVLADFNKRKIKYLEWYRSIYEPGTGMQKFLAVIGYYSYWIWLFGLSLINILPGRRKYKIGNSIRALSEARKHVMSPEFAEIPKWRVKR